jgi:hypothetical protein
MLSCQERWWPGEIRNTTTAMMSSTVRRDRTRAVIGYARLKASLGMRTHETSCEVLQMTLSPDSSHLSIRR